MSETKPIPLGRYRHYKGKHYTVIGEARHSETLEELVVYRQEYGDQAIWVRPKRMFTENVNVDGQDVPRFERLSPEVQEIVGVIEAAIYVDDLDETENFYHTVLGLHVVVKEAGRHVFFRAGPASVLLAFIAHTTLKGDQLPAHGGSGPGHFALGIDADALNPWRQKLHASGIAIEKAVDWPRGGKSIYFRDPSGNLVELVTPGIWGLPTGW